MSKIVEKECLIVNRLGLHARAAAKFVQTASDFEADVDIIKNENNNNQTVNGKSILGVMMLAAAKGTTITIRATGKDAETAIGQLDALIQDKFGEAE